MSLLGEPSEQVVLDFSMVKVPVDSWSYQRYGVDGEIKELKDRCFVYAKCPISEPRDESPSPCVPIAGIEEAEGDGSQRVG